METHLMGGARILFVMAAEQEYRSALRARIRPLLTGVGPVEAAIETAIALQRLADTKGLSYRLARPAREPAN